VSREDHPGGKRVQRGGAQDLEISRGSLWDGSSAKKVKVKGGKDIRKGLPGFQGMAGIANPKKGLSATEKKVLANIKGQATV